ncbi:AAA family ATPase [Micromonospora sp. H61]|uniref:AAA family ATPase n=1 Tax=Micromonospora sp. H61 TaxID=2824888 RepID=UPI001B38FC81|nr:AAA family ATPase [Micromonospora sp. H61]MBQ0994925.1 AAA family ATPase [Micromonospora sp. H61]
MSWEPLYRGDGIPRTVDLPAPPPWRVFPRPSSAVPFEATPDLTDAVNAALCLRRPLLITGPAGSGKSTVIESVATELGLGAVLRWHITSRSTVSEALYQYDVLGRIHAQQLGQPSDDIGHFVRLGPLGTALCDVGAPRALLIDEVDKGDLDLPSDLLNVLERGEFDMPELARFEADTVEVREWDGAARRAILRGRVQCRNFPFIVMTSNGEREFPAAFLRRCVRFTMPAPSEETLSRIVAAHLGMEAAGRTGAQELVRAFLDRLNGGDQLAIDQLLNAVFLLTGGRAPEEEQRHDIERTVLRSLSDA